MSDLIIEIGDAEFRAKFEKAKSPKTCAAFEAAITQISRELRQFKRQSEDARRTAVRKLLFRWHPDKNPHQVELQYP